jgi:antitoxin CptB
MFEPVTKPGTETREHRLKRLKMRSWRRGIKEMDLILGAFADDQLETLTPDDLDAYEAMLSENDQDLYKWVSGALPMPPEHEGILSVVANFHKIEH